MVTICHGFSFSLQDVGRPNYYPLNPFSLVYSAPVSAKIAKQNADMNLL